MDYIVPCFYVLMSGHVGSEAFLGVNLLWDEDFGEMGY